MDSPATARRFPARQSRSSSCRSSVRWKGSQRYGPPMAGDQSEWKPDLSSFGHHHQHIVQAGQLSTSVARVQLW